MKYLPLNKFGKIFGPAFFFPRALLFAILSLFLLSFPPSVFSNTESSALIEIRHGNHPESNYSRIVFELNGDGRLEIVPSLHGDNTIRLRLKGVRLNSDGLSCRTANLNPKAMFSNTAKSFLCVFQGRVVEAVEVSDASKDSLEISVQLLNVQLSELSLRLKRFKGSMKSGKDNRITRHILDLGYGGEKAFVGGRQRKEPVKMSEKTTRELPLIPKKDTYKPAALLAEKTNVREFPIIQDKKVLGQPAFEAPVKESRLNMAPGPQKANVIIPLDNMPAAKRDKILKLTLEARKKGGGTEFFGETNLPDGAKLGIVANEIGGVFSQEFGIDVKNGKYTTGIFTSRGVPFYRSVEVKLFALIDSKWQSPDVLRKMRIYPALEKRRNFEMARTFEFKDGAVDLVAEIRRALLGRRYSLEVATKMISKYGIPKTSNSAGNRHWVARFPKKSFSLTVNKGTKIIESVIRE